MTTKVERPPEILVHPPPPPAPSDWRVPGASGALVVGGALGIVLGVLGLANVVPVVLDGIAILALGGAIIVGGTLLTMAISRRGPVSEPDPETAVGGFTGQIILGVLAVLLAIWSLTGTSSVNLISVAVILLGIALWSGGPAQAAWARTWWPSGHASERTLSGRPGVTVAIGIALVILGVLALFSVSPRILTLLSVIAGGCALFLTAASVMGKTPRRIGLK